MCQMRWQNGTYECYRLDKKRETTVSPADRNYSVTYRQKLQCHLPTETTVSPTDRGSTITPTALQNAYFNEQITVVGLSSFIPQI